MPRRQSRRKLCEPNRLVWPTLSDDDEKEVTEKVKRIFKKYRECMRRKVTKAQKTQEIKAPLSGKEMQERTAFRSTFVIGFNAVIRKLEQKKLRVVLMDRAANPGVLKRAILSMAVQNRCPALLVADLLSAIHKSWPGLKSCTCLGITESLCKNDFDDLVSFIQMKNLISFDEPDIPSTNISEALALEKMGESNKEGVSQPESKLRIKPVRPTVDYTKYYIPATEKPAEKKFEGQSFIEIGDDNGDEIVIFKHGRRVTEALSKDIECYGIHPAFIGKWCDIEMNKSVKRKHSDTNLVRSDYKLVSIQELKPNDSKVKKVKRKSKVEKYGSTKKNKS